MVRPIIKCNYKTKINEIQIGDKIIWLKMNDGREKVFTLVK